MKMKHLLIPIVAATLAVGNLSAAGLGPKITNINFADGKINLSVNSDCSFDLFGSTDMINWDSLTSYLTSPGNSGNHSFVVKPARPMFFFKVRERQGPTQSVPEPGSGLAMGLAGFAGLLLFKNKLRS